MKKRTEGRSNFKLLITAEINQSRIMHLREAQLEWFDESNLMPSSKPIRSNSELIGLNPIFYEGLIS